MSTTALFQTGAPDGARMRVPTFVRPTSRGASGIVYDFHRVAPVRASSASSEPRNVQHS